MAQIPNPFKRLWRPEASLPGRSGAWRRWVFGLIIGALLWFLLSRFAEIETIARTLEHGQWQWLLVAVLFQFLCYGLYALNYQQTFQAVGIQRQARELFPVLLGSLAVGEIAPLGWAAGSAVIIQYAISSGSPPERATVATLLAQAADLLMFSLTFGIGMVFLFLQHDLRPYEIAGATILLIMNVALGSLLVLGLWQPDFLFSLLKRMPRTADWAHRLSARLSETAAEVRAHPRCAVAALLSTLSAHFANISSLFLVFYAFGQPIGPGALVAGYGVGILMWMISPIPSGIGLVEGATALTYTSLGIPAGNAAVIAIAYRGLSFWLPFFAGVICLRKLHLRTPQD